MQIYEKNIVGKHSQVNFSAAQKHEASTATSGIILLFSESDTTEEDDTKSFSVCHGASSIDDHKMKSLPFGFPIALTCFFNRLVTIEFLIFQRWFPP